MNWLDNVVVDWISWNIFPISIAGIIAVALLGLGLAINANHKEQVRFMELCMLEQPEYQCMILWRGGKRSMVPIPIVVPIR
ncbi:MAG: hypothetical protein V3S69_04240 [Dehalococcoidales bacterium]